MRTGRHTAEQIVAKLRQAEVELARGQSIAQISKHWGITEQTYYRWRKEFGGLRLDQAKRLKQLEQENTRLKKVVADLTLDMRRFTTGTPQGEVAPQPTATGNVGGTVGEEDAGQSRTDGQRRSQTPPAA
ncbi:MAG: transposase [Phycisphaerae bacterium]|nr:transposase [Phycisphaerae bacterium]